ncbi:MAG: NTP transferase domain-containing protein [Candidatus Methanofastidiosum sp.]|nr:NTP transferase domain-containing protein [Methanofastidiosum sp.]
MFKNTVIMAAGAGLRLKELTINAPKALLEVNGMPLLSYSLNQINKIVDNIFITVGYKKNKIIDYFSDNKKYRIIDTSYKGNSWWIFNSLLKNFNEPVLVLPCDIITIIDLSFIYLNYLSLGCPPCMLVPVQPVKGIDGDFIEEKNNVVLSISRNFSTPIYCSGIQVINPLYINETMNEQNDFNQLWHQLICNNMLYVSSIYPHPWFSIDTKEQVVRYLERNDCHTF